MYEKHEYKKHDIIFQNSEKISKRGVNSQTQAFGLKLNREQIRFQSSKTTQIKFFRKRGLFFSNLTYF